MSKETTAVLETEEVAAPEEEATPLSVRAQEFIKDLCEEFNPGEKPLSTPLDRDQLEVLLTMVRGSLILSAMAGIPQATFVHFPVDRVANTEDLSLVAADLARLKQQKERGEPERVLGTFHTLDGLVPDPNARIQYLNDCLQKLTRLRDQAEQEIEKGERER